MPSDEQTTLIEKILLYLNEYIDEFAVEELQMAWKSIGQRMGFVSAFDAMRKIGTPPKKKFRKLKFCLNQLNKDDYTQKK